MKTKEVPLMSHSQELFSTFFEDNTKYSEVEFRGFIIVQVIKNEYDLQKHGPYGKPIASYAVYTKKSLETAKERGYIHSL